MDNKSKTTLKNELRSHYMDIVKKCLADLSEEILVTSSNEIALPCVDSEGNDEFMVITFKVPSGSRDGEPYDGYAIAEDYKSKCEANALKAEEAKAKKEAKIAKDKAEREAKAKARAEHKGN